MSRENNVVTRDIITIYDTVISSEAGDKVFEPGIFLFRRQILQTFEGGGVVGGGV